MTHRNDPAVIERLLSTPGRWAVVGLSRNRARTAYDIASYVQELGMEIVPVHPRAETVHGAQGYATLADVPGRIDVVDVLDRKSTRLNSSHVAISYAVFCLKKKRRKQIR